MQKRIAEVRNGAFPHIPGNDFVLSYPNAGTVSGESLVLPKRLGRVS